MIRMILIAVSVLVVMTGVVSAHGGRVVGVISNADSKEPIAFSSVQIDGTHLGAVADSAGRYVLDHVPVGQSVLVVTAVGFEAKRVKVTIAEGATSELTTALKPSQVELGQIVVTGTRTPRYVRDAPVFTEVVSRASIEDKAAHNIFDALDGESGVRVEEQCQACNFSILRMQGLGADHTQILLDGQPVYSGLAAVYGLQQLSTADVDRIEIVKGAGSALYGSQAVAGAINIVSSVPHQTEGTVSMEMGEHGTNWYSLRAGSRRNGLGLFLFAQLNEQDELDETGDSDAPGGVDEPDGWIDRVRTSAKNLGFNMFLDNVLTADQLVIRGRLTSENRAGGWLTDNLFENPFAAGTENIVTDRISGQAEYQLWFGEGTEVNASVSVAQQKRDATNDTFLGDYEAAYGVTPPVELMRPYVADEDLLTVNLNVNQPFGAKHRGLFGVQFSRNSLEESGMYLDGETATPYSSSSSKSAWEIGAYVQDDFKLTDKIELVGGLRFDHHNSEDEFRGSGDVLAEGLPPLEYEESTVNPRFSVKYSATDALVLRASVGTGYRVPYGFSEDLHLCSGSPRVYKGGDLKAEKSFSVSLSGDYTVSRLTASVNLYRTDLRDAISFAEADPEVYNLGYTYQWENIDDAYVTGAEFNGSMSLGYGVVLETRFELFSGKYDSPRQDWVGTPYEAISRNISRYPSVSGGFKVDYTVGEWNFVADADVKGKMYIDLTEPENPDDVKIHETETFMTVDAKMSRKVFERYTVYLGAKNLTDYTQEEKHISDAAFQYAPMYGRLIYGGIQISL